MEISYCCAARQGDVLGLQRKQLLNEGIYIKQGKTNKAQIKRWTPRLKAAVELALKQQVTHNLLYVFADPKGNKVSAVRLRHWYAAAKAQAQAANPTMKIDFTYHDIKAKSISDWTGDKQKFSGHKTAAQVAVYDRKTQVVDSHDYGKNNKR